MAIINELYNVLERIKVLHHSNKTVKASEIMSLVHIPDFDDFEYTVLHNITNKIYSNFILNEDFIKKTKKLLNDTFDEIDSGNLDSHNSLPPGISDLDLCREILQNDRLHQIKTMPLVAAFYSPVYSLFRSQYYNILFISHSERYYSEIVQDPFIKSSHSVSTINLYYRELRHKHFGNTYGYCCIISLSIPAYQLVLFDKLKIRDRSLAKIYVNVSHYSNNVISWLKEHIVIEDEKVLVNNNIRR